MRFAARALACWALVTCGGELASRDGAPAGVAVARADEAWRAEFEEVCSKTQDAMALSSDDLRSLVGRCDRLKPAIAGLQESDRKVYSRRLQACRDLYQFVLESREG
jgi:hypothetical protein